MKIDNKKLVAALKKGNISDDEIDKILEESKNLDIPIEEIIAAKHLLTDNELGRIIAKIIGFPYINLSDIEIQSEILELIPENIALKQGVITFDIDEKTNKIQIATADPFDLEMLNDIQKKTGREYQNFSAKVFYRCPVQV